MENNKISKCAVDLNIQNTFVPHTLILNIQKLNKSIIHIRSTENNTYNIYNKKDNVNNRRLFI